MDPGCRYNIWSLCYPQTDWFLCCPILPIYRTKARDLLSDLWTFIFIFFIWGEMRKTEPCYVILNGLPSLCSLDLTQTHRNLLPQLSESWDHMSSCTSCCKFSTNKKLRARTILRLTPRCGPSCAHYWWPWRRLPFETLVTIVHLRQFLEVTWDNVESHTLGGFCQRPHIRRHLLKVSWNIQPHCGWITAKVILKDGLWPIMVMTSSRATFWWWGNWLSMLLKPKYVML